MFGEDSKGNSESRTGNRETLLMEGGSGYLFAKYMLFLGVVTVLTWVGSHNAMTPEPPYHYEYAAVAYAALLAAAYLGFTARTAWRVGAITPRKAESVGEMDPGTRGRLLECVFNALYMALLTLPFLAVVRILTLLNNREVVMILSLLVGCFTTYRFISLRLGRALRNHPRGLYMLQRALVVVVLFISLAIYPPLSPLHALHRITALSALRINDAGFYHPLGPYLITLLLHGLMLGALISLDLYLGRRGSTGHGT